MMMFSQNRRYFEEIYREMLNETFGTRLREFKKAVAAHNFSIEHRSILDAAIVALDDLLPRRNMIVHGVTMEVGFRDEEPKSYRIGAPRGNLDYLNEFLQGAAKVEHAFTAEKIREAVADCKSLANQIGPITAALLKQIIATQKS